MTISYIDGNKTYFCSIGQDANSDMRRHKDKEKNKQCDTDKVEKTIIIYVSCVGVIATVNQI